MMAMAARSLGYRIHVMDPDPSCPARGLWWTPVSRAIGTIARAAGELARGQRRGDAGDRAGFAGLPGGGGAVCSGAAGKRICWRSFRTAFCKKTGCWSTGFRSGGYRAIESEADLQEATLALGGRCFREDGARRLRWARGRRRSASGGRLGPMAEEVHAAWLALGERACIAEQALELDKEISVMVARSPSGEVKSFPSAAKPSREPDIGLERDSFFDSRRAGGAGSGDCVAAG